MVNDQTIHAFDLGIYNPQRMTNSKVYVNQATKENKILFQEDFFNPDDPRPWEIRYDNGYPNVFYDPKYNKYRCYYSTFTKDDESEMYSRQERAKRDYNPNTTRIVSLCYAESDDGVNWVKPNLGLVEWRGSRDNNIIDHFLHGTSVMYDENEVDESKRYKMFTKIDYGGSHHFIAVAFSEDGINFCDYIPISNFNPRADTYNSIYFDELLGEYVLITRHWRDSFRVPCLSFSKDFVNWSEPKEANVPIYYDRQIYSMPIFKDGNYRIALASIIHEGDTEDPDFDKVDLELMYSYRQNGFNFVESGQPFIQRGDGEYPDGAFDSSCIFSALPVKQGNRTYFYYFGGNGRHTNFRETHMARAHIENDRYSYLGQKNSENVSKVVTNNFVFLEDNFLLDAEIEDDGFIEIKLLNNDYQVIEDVFVSLEKEDIGYRVKFSRDLDYAPVRLSFEFKNAKIYKLSGMLDVLRIETENTLLRY